MGRKRKIPEVGTENGDGVEKKPSQRVLRSHKIHGFSELEWGKGKKEVFVTLRGGDGVTVEKNRVSDLKTMCLVEPKEKRVLGNLKARNLQPEFDKEIEECHQCRRKNDQEAMLVCCRSCLTNGFCVTCIQKWYRQWSLFAVGECCPVCCGNCSCEACLSIDKMPSQQAAEQSSIGHVTKGKEIRGQQEIMRKGEEVQVNEEEPSQPLSEQCSIRYAMREESTDKLEEGSDGEEEVIIIEQSQSSVSTQPKQSIEALAILETYLQQHSELITSANTNEDPIYDTEEVARAKAKLQRISAVSIDDLMEEDCLQSLKSSLEILRKADDRGEAESSSIETVLSKLYFVESKYPLARRITNEVEEAFKKKLELQREVETYAHHSSEAEQEESELVNEITAKKVMIAFLKRKMATEEVELKELEMSHVTKKIRSSEFSSKHEQYQRMLDNHCINEKTRVKNALQAQKDFKSTTETWQQMQKLLRSLCLLKEETAS